MKLFLSALLFTLALSSPLAPESAVKAQTELKTTPIGDLEVRAFAKRLCLRMATAGERGQDIVKTMEDQILGYLKITRDTPDYKEKIIAFWNANKNDFICKGKVDSATRESEHLMKRAIALSLHGKVFDKFFFDTDELEFDYNAIEYVIPVPPTEYGNPPPGGVTHAAWGVGEPETVFDYLNKILANPASSKQFVISDIKDLRDSLRDEFNAKTAAELMAVSHE